MLRWVAERVPINISPGYASTYHARVDLASFLRHANHRGTVLIDGYLRPGTRFAVPIVIVLAASPVGAVLALRHPKVALGLAATGTVAAGVTVRALGHVAKTPSPSPSSPSRSDSATSPACGAASYCDFAGAWPNRPSPVRILDA